MEDFTIGDQVKIKNPSLAFQKDLVYIVTKVLKTVVHCYEVSDQKHIYKNINRKLITKF